MEQVEFVNPTAQILALVIQGGIAMLLALICWIVRRAYITIRDALEHLQDVQDRLGGLEERDAARAGENQRIRDELNWLKGKMNLSLDLPVSPTTTERVK